MNISKLYKVEKSSMKEDLDNINQMLVASESSIEKIISFDGGNTVFVEVVLHNQNMPLIS